MGLQKQAGGDPETFCPMEEKTVKPEFVDNRELLLVEAVNAHLDWLNETYREPVEMSVATGYFNPEGFALVADRLKRLSRVRLLLGAEPIPPPAQPLRMPGDPPP